MATTYKTLVETQPGDPSTSTWPVATDTFCATPAAALATSHFRIQYAISIIATFILNVGLNYAFLYKTSHIGIWSTAPNESSSTLPVALDMILTSFCIVSLTVACNTPGIRKAIQKAEISPIHPTELSHGWYHLFPALHVEVSWLRAIVFGVQYVIMFTGLSIVFVYILAISGAFHGPSTFVDAYVSTTAWIWSKSCWAALCAACTFPIHYLAALNVEILPHHVWENYLVNIKLKTNNV